MKRVALGAAFLIGAATPIALAAVAAQPAGATPGVPDHLVILSQPPTTTVSGVPFGGPIFAVVDSTGAVVTADNSTTVVLANAPSTPTSGSGTLGGCVQGDSLGNPEVNGIIHFSGCAETGIGSGFKIRATAASLPTQTVDTAAFSTSNDIIAAGGSDTIESLDGKIFANTESSPNVKNIPVPAHLPAAGFAVAGDGNCNNVTYRADGTGDSPGNGFFLSPANSGEGRNDLHNAVTGGPSWPTGPTGSAYSPTVSGHTVQATVTNGGCTDIARGSSKSGVTKQENYAFAVDAVGWGTTSLKAPASLTLDQLQAIWTCRVNDWSQVGGAPGKIVRVLPKFGSGTRKYFLTNVIGVPGSGVTGQFEDDNNGWVPPTSGTPSYSGFDSSTGLAVTAGSGTINCDPAIGQGGSSANALTPGGNKGVEENDGSQFQGGACSQTTAHTGCPLAFDSHVNKTGLDTYTFPYSAGKWAAQSTHAGNPTTDLRNAARMGGVVGVAVSPNPTFPTAYPIRFNGDQFQLNNGTVLAGSSGSRTVSVDMTNNNGIGQQVIALHTCTVGSPAAGDFTSADVGFNLQQTLPSPGSPPVFNIFDGTNILSVPDNCHAVIDTSIKATGTSVSLLLGWAVVSEKNPMVQGASVTSATGAQYPGSRFLFNILEDHTLEPSYTAARDLVGFDVPTANGNVSSLCSGYDVGLINQEGFLDLAPVVPSSGNTNAVTCRAFVNP